MKPGCIGKSNTDNLLAPTDLTENLYKKKKICNDATQKSAPWALFRIPTELEPMESIF
jgi:hypothetical protein